MEPADFILRPLNQADLDEVVEIEKLCFTTPWSKALFAEELKNEICHWYAATPSPPPASIGRAEMRVKVAGYMGFWKAVDEAHITNLAVHPQYRGLGLGRRLVTHLLDQAKVLGCLRATLEVRPSNEPAVKLYTSLGFEPVAFRPKYYLDNGEDALIMWKNTL